MCKEDKVVILNEVCVPGMENGIHDGTMEEICTKCGNLKKDCTCEK